MQIVKGRHLPAAQTDKDSGTSSPCACENLYQDHSKCCMQVDKGMHWGDIESEEEEESSEEEEEEEEEEDEEAGDEAALADGMSSIASGIASGVATGMSSLPSGIETPSEILDLRKGKAGTSWSPRPSG